MNKNVIAGLLVISSLMTGNALAESVQQWINKMTSSSHNGNYQGTFVFWRDQKLETMHVAHGNKNGHIWVSLKSLSGEPRELIHVDGEVTSILPDKQLVSINEMTTSLPFHPDLPKDIKQLNRHYQLSLLGEDRVAERDTQIILVKPKDQYRYGFKYWLDKESGMMLRCDVINKQQKVLEHMMFTEFKYLDKPPADSFRRTRIPHGYTIIKQNESEPLKAGSQWFAQKLPKGFMLTKNLLKPMRKKQASVQQLVFSDGLASVSVFIDKNVSRPHQLDGHTKMGSVNAYGRMLKKHQITAIGEVPAETVELIANAIQHRHD